MAELDQAKDQDLLFPVKVGLQSYLVNREVIKEAIAMRDRINADFAAIYLQFKGVSMDVALSILALPSHSFAIARNDSGRPLPS